MIFKTIKSVSYFIFIFCSCQTLSSQNIISGTIQDENKKPIVSANIILRELSGKIISFTHSDEMGKYEISTIKLGTFIVAMKSMGHEHEEKEIIFNKNQERFTYDVILKNTSTEIKEIVITGTKPITIKKDTIIFNAKSFLQGNEQTVEDLLKKIPGLQVDANGTIKVGQQEVEKIMIDGDDFFDKGYKVMTKNMPVHPIDKIELYENYSNNKHLKGIENSKKVALNLTLKEESKRIWFGNIETGYGLFSENRYELKGNLMNFGKKNKHYFITNFNNTGFDATGDINHLIRPYREGGSADLGDNVNSSSLLNMATELPDLKQKRIHLNNTELLSLNSIYKLNEKAKLKTIGFLNTDEVDYFRSSLQQFSSNNTSFTNFEDFIGRKKQITGFGKIDFIYDISKTKTVEFTSKFNHTNEKNKSDLRFNTDQINERLLTQNQLIDQKLTFTNKFKPNQVLVLSGRYINEKTPQNYSVNQFIFTDLFSERANNTKQISENQLQFAGIEAHLLGRRKNEDLFEFKIGNQLRIDQLNTQFELLENQTSISFPEGYQNNFKYVTNDLYVSSKYQKKIKKFTFFTVANFHYLYNEMDYLQQKKTQDPFYIVPKTGVEWKMNTKNTLSSSYTYSVTNTDVTSVFPGYIQTGFRSLNKGLGAFNQLEGSTVNLNYSYGNWGDKFFSNTLILFTKNNDFISSNSNIAQNYSQTEKIIIQDRESLTFSSNINRFFKPIKSNLKLKVSATKSNFKNIVNNSNLRAITNQSATYGFELRSGFKGVFNYHFGSDWTFSNVTTTIENSVTNNMSFVDLFFVVNDRLYFQIQTERYYFGNLNSKEANYHFLDFKVNYKLLENKLNLSLSGNNLLNTETFKDYSISDISIAKTEYKLQPRYVLLTAEYRF